MPSAPEFRRPLSPCNTPTRRCPVPRGAASRRILIVRLGSHGDIVMGTPLAAALRAAYPDAWLTWMVERAHQEAIDANPYVDELLDWDGGYFREMLPAAPPDTHWKSQWKRMTREGRLLGWAWLRAALKVRRRLRRRRFDILITFHGEHWPSLARFLGIPTRIGVFDMFPQFNAARPEYRGLYTTSYAAEDLPPHRTDIHLLPLRALGLPEPAEKCMSLGYTAEDAAVADGFLREVGVTGEYVVVAPHTTWETRNWPHERYEELCDRLARQADRRVVLIGGPDERRAVERIAARTRTNPVRAAGLLTFRQMGALIARASVLVSGDTGPMHVAAAVGTPYVALFGPTPAAGRAPLAGRGRVLMHPTSCGPCDQPRCGNEEDSRILCMRLITVPEVLEAACALMAAAPKVREV